MRNILTKPQNLTAEVETLIAKDKIDAGTTERKYELTDLTVNYYRTTLYRIRALKDFGNVKKGDLGGFVESKANLSQDGDCWVADGARVTENARVEGNARVGGTAEVFGNAHVYGNARVGGTARVYGYARVYGDAEVLENAEVYGNAHVYGHAKVFENAEVCGNKRLY